MSFIVSNIALLLRRGFTARRLIESGAAFSIGDITVRWNQLVVILTTIPVLLILTWLVKTTKQGKGMRAVAQDQDAAAMMGINVNRTISFTFILAGSLAGAAGLLFLLLYNMRFNTGFELGLIASRPPCSRHRQPAGATRAASSSAHPVVERGLTHWTAGGSDPPARVRILIAIPVFRPEGLLGERTPEGA
jgi:branched-chain amino acid transport system permease protein